MQGYILNITKVKDEDLIVTLLSKNRLKTLYRFYGARHSVINIGFHVDFIVQSSSASTISMLREVVQLGTPWLGNIYIFDIWQNFIKLLYKHLQDINEIDEFYYSLLHKSSQKLTKQAPKRVIVEAYLELLEHEGRLHTDFYCMICEKYIEENPVIKRSYLLACQECLVGFSFDKEVLQECFESKSTLNLSDKDVDLLWKTLLEGI